MNISGISINIKSTHEILMAMVTEIQEKRQYYLELEKQAILEERQKQNPSFEETLREKSVNRSKSTEGETDEEVKRPFTTPKFISVANFR